MTTSVVFQSFAEIKTKKNHQIAFVKSLQNVARTAASRRQQFNAPCVLMPSNLVSSYWLVAWSTTNKTIKVTHIQPVQQPAALHDVCSTTCSNGRWSTNLSTTWREAGVVVVAHRLQIVVVKVGRTGLTVLSSIIYTWDDLNLPPPLCGWGWCHGAFKFAKHLLSSAWGCLYWDIWDFWVKIIQAQAQMKRGQIGGEGGWGKGISNITQITSFLSNETQA